jgi:arsenite methyltransferase
MGISSSKNRVGIWSGVLAGLSILTCYGTLVLVAILGLIEIQLEIHEGAWATVIVVLAWAAVVAIVVEFQRLRFIAPLVTVILGALLITAVMFVSYNRIVEILGFALILTAVIWNRQFAAKRYRKTIDGD